MYLVGWALLLHVSGTLAASAQLQPQTTQNEAVHTVTGRVVNGSNGAPIGRALVRVGARAVLTDGEGRFTLRELAGQSVLFQVSKPGFAPSEDAETQMAPVQISDPGAPVELKLYPDGIVMGSVTERDGLPVVRANLTVMRAQYTPGGPRMTNVGFTVTDSHGQYRFREPPGRYRVLLRFSPRISESGEAMLPEHFPASPESSDAGFFDLQMGEEKVVNLHPRVGPAYVVLLHTENASQNGSLQVTAIRQTGEAFQIGAQPDAHAGDFRLRLPSGAYVLKAQSRDRQGQSLSVGVTKVNVAGHDVSGVSLEMAPAASIPVEVQVEAPETVSSPVQAQIAPSNLFLFGLRLRSLGEQGEQGDGANNDVTVQISANGSGAFQVPPGRYRLESMLALSTGFLISSAYSGTANLMTDDLVVGAGTGGAPIRISVRRSTGQINGKLTLPAEAAIAPSTMIYFLPQFPCLQPAAQTRSSSSGAWNAILPAGKYVAIATRHTIEADLRDPAVAAGYGRLGTPFEVNQTTATTVDLTLPREPGSAR